MSSPEVEAVLPQVRFALGFIPFVHRAILCRFSIDGEPLPERSLISMERKTETATAVVRQDAVGFVLAGGQSSRMGVDKALVLLDGRPLVSHALGILREADLESSLAGGQPALAGFAPLVEDKQSGLGPLSGICAALASTTSQWSIFIPVDMPLLPASLLRFLLDHARITGTPVTVTSVNGFAQSFPVVLDRAVLARLLHEMQSGRGGCFSGFQAAAENLGEAVTVIPVEPLVQCGQISHSRGLPAAWWFLNVNTAEDLRRAEVHAASADRVSLSYEDGRLSPQSGCLRSADARNRGEAGRAP
jgi:molybdopterin-guanine dinucleotide biosynthesis protein A